MSEEIHTLMPGEVAGGTLLTSDEQSTNAPAVAADVDAGGKKKRSRPVKSRALNKKSLSNIQALEQQCRQMALPLFFNDTAPVRSIGFTSAIDGEGKSFLSMVMAKTIAEVSPVPVTLLECNWQHPTLHEYYDLPAQPGLAEWLRGECDKSAIRQRINYNLTVIPAGNGRQDALGLLQQLRQKGLVDTLAVASELFIVDLPATLTTHYGVSAASIVDALFVVVRAGVTPESMIRRTYKQLANLPLQGLVLNQAKSRIPRWLGQFL